MALLLAANTRKPWVEVAVEYPDPNNNLRMGARLVLDGIVSISIQRNEEPSSDALDFEIANGDARYSPLRVSP